MPVWLPDPLDVPVPPWPVIVLPVVNVRLLEPELVPVPPCPVTVLPVVKVSVLPPPELEDVAVPPLVDVLPPDDVEKVEVESVTRCTPVDRRLRAGRGPGLAGLGPGLLRTIFYPRLCCARAVMAVSAA